MSRNDSPDCTRVVDQLFERYGLHPVVLDIGASGPPRTTWDFVARHSVFVGFDPDLREISELAGTGFYRAVMVNEAVTAEKDKDRITFFLTRSPYCSSTLEPDLNVQADYSLADLYEVERQVEVKATTLDAVLRRLDLERVHWFKVDSQGTDVRLFNSLSPQVRDRVLCVEVEPGLIATYKGEDVFTEAHRVLIEQGFWLSDANLCGSPRIRQSSMLRLRQSQPAFDATMAGARCRVAPSWVEATYLRSIDHLTRQSAPATDYVLLWAFALVGKQWGFALDVAWAYEERFGLDETARAMAMPLVEWFERPAPRPRAIRRIKALVPVAVKQWVKQQLL